MILDGSQRSTGLGQVMRHRLANLVHLPPRSENVTTGLNPCLAPFLTMSDASRSRKLRTIAGETGTVRASPHTVEAYGLVENPSTFALLIDHVSAAAQARRTAR